MKKTNPTKGFLIVASSYIHFYKMALNLIESIKDYYPEAKICLVTEERFCDGREKIADDLIFCGDNYREKLWALSQTPYDITAYIDADCEVRHEDINGIFDQLKDNDITLVPIKQEDENFYAYVTWPGGSLKWHGGIILYDNRIDIVKGFMLDWNYYYHRQRARSWWPALKPSGEPDYDLHPNHMGKWDQFTLWFLTEKNEKYKDLKIGTFEEPYRWNYFSTFEYKTKLGLNILNPIIYHLSSIGIKPWNPSQLHKDRY